MAKLEKINNNNFTTTDMNALFLDNNVFNPIRKNVLASVADLTLPSEAVYAMEDGINGTESVQLLIEQWHEVKTTTDNFRNLYVNDVDPAIVRVRDSMLQKDEEIAQQLNFEGVDTNAVLSAATSNITNKIANTMQFILKGLTLDEDDYPEYMTDDEEVNKEILRLLNLYGEDLSGVYDDMDFSWEDSSEITKKALTRILEVDAEYIDGHLSNKKCADQEARVETILMYLSNGTGATETTVFNSQYMTQLEGYLTSDIAKQYISELKVLQRNDYNYVPGLSTLNVRINGVGIIFEFEDSQNGDVTEILCHTSEDRTERCMKYWEKENPGLYDYTLSLMSREQIVDMYCKAENSADISLLDNLLKTDGSYENVFTVDPEKLSNTGALLLGQYGCNMVELAETNSNIYNQYYTFLNQMCSVHYEGDVTPDIDGINNNGYIEKYALGSSLVTDSYLEIAWATSSSDEDADLAKQIAAAKKNELIGFSLYGYAQQADDNVLGVEVELVNVEETDELHITDISRVTKYKQKEHPTSSGLNNYGGDYLDTYWEIEKSSEYNKVKLHSMGGLKAVDTIAGDVIEDLNNKKVEMSKEVAADTAISVVGIFCEPAGKALTVINAINEGDEETIAKEGIDLTDKDSTIGKYGRTGITLYSAISGYSKDLEDINAEIEDLQDIQKVANFYTANSYNFIGSDDNYYIKIDDLNMIRLIQNWQTNGIQALYDNQEVYNNLDKYYDVIIEDLVKEENAKNDSEWEHITNFVTSTHIYTKEEIEKACNTLIYGSDSGKDTYDSILEIPTDLFTMCEEQMNDYLGGDVASIESEIQTHRMDYKAP